MALLAMCSFLHAIGNVPTTLNHVSRILSRSSGPQMVNVDAGWCVAGVQYEQVGMAVVLHPDQTVSAHHCATQPYLTVPLPQ